MKRFLKILCTLLTVVVLCGVIALAGCGDSTVSVTSIKFSYSDGYDDIYTITYSDGTTDTFTVTNGKDGEDGDDGEDGKDGANDYASVINDCLQSVTKIYTEFSVRLSSGTARAYSTGSGVIYRMDDDYTYIITNYHVMYVSSSYTFTGVYCYLYGSEGSPEIVTKNAAGNPTSYDYGEYAIECEFLGGSADSDVAVLRADTSDIKAINSGVKCVTLGDQYYVGETAIAIGNGENLGMSVTEGIISVDSEYISVTVGDAARTYRCMRIDAAIYEGNSGGGLFNGEGQLIGIVNAGNSTLAHVNYALPLASVKGTADNIIYYAENGDTTGSAYVASLGATLSSANSKYVYDAEIGYGVISEDALVSEVSSGSIAETLGIVDGSVIEKMIINGTEYEITRYYQIDDLMLTVRADDVISFVITADGSEIATAEYTVLSSDLAARE